MGSDAEHCVGYVTGFEDTALMWQLVDGDIPQAKVPRFCLKPTLTIEVIIRKIPIWAIEHPQAKKGAALELLLDMLIANYPCS